MQPVLGISVFFTLSALMYGEWENLKISKEINEKVSATSDVVVETADIVEETNTII